MKITIGNTTYTEIFDITFAPEVDVLSETVPINSFDAKIKTNDTINITNLGDAAILKTDNDIVFASYKLSKVKRLSDEVVQIHAEDQLSQLDTITMPAFFYNGYSLDIAVYDLIRQVRTITGDEYEPSIAIQQAESYPNIEGYCPEQTARERLQAICFVAGYYMLTAYHSYDVVLMPVEELFGGDPDYIEEAHVMWRPENGDQNFVTDIKGEYFLLTEIIQSLITSTTEYVTVDTPTTKYYEVLRYPFSWKNPYVSSDVPKNQLELYDNMLINYDNVDNIKARMATVYGRNGGLEMTVEIVDPNTYYVVGQLVAFPTGVGREIAVGYITSQNIVFGRNIKMEMTVKVIAYRQGYYLTILKKDGNNLITWERHLMLAGHSYNLSCGDIETGSGLNRTVFSTTHTSVSGTMPENDVEVTVQYFQVLSINGGKMYVKGALHAQKLNDVVVVTGNQTVPVPADEVDTIEYDLSLFIKNGKMKAEGVKSASQTNDRVEIQGYE